MGTRFHRLKDHFKHLETALTLEEDQAAAQRAATEEQERIAAEALQAEALAMHQLNSTETNEQNLLKEEEDLRKDVKDDADEMGEQFATPAPPPAPVTLVEKGKKVAESMEKNVKQTAENVEEKVVEASREFRTMVGQLR